MDKSKGVCSEKGNTGDMGSSAQLTTTTVTHESNELLHCKQTLCFDNMNDSNTVIDNDIQETMNTIVKLVDYQPSNILAALLQNSTVALFHYEKSTLPNLEVFSPDHACYEPNQEFMQELDNRIDDPSLTQQKLKMCEALSMYNRKSAMCDNR